MASQARKMVEKAVLALLLAELKKDGWRVSRIHDGDNDWKTLNPCNVEHEVFQLDDCHLQFNKGRKVAHWVKLVMGNDGTDMISDWGYSDGDPDGFNATMQRVSRLIDLAPVRFVVSSSLRRAAAGAPR